MRDPGFAERAWAAGLFDSEGCTNFHIERSGQRRLRISVPQSGHGRVPEVLTHFQSVAGAGAIYGPFPNGSHVWEIRGAASVRVVTLIWPWLGTVKRTQFGRALGSYNDALKTARAKTLPFVAPVLEAETIASFGLAWAAGLFDGDGSTCNSARHLKDGVESFGIKASVSQSGPLGVPEVLQRLQSIVGFGQIYGCRWRNSTEPGFDWTIQAYRDVRRLRVLLGPLIGPVKVAQMDQALVRFEQSPHRRKSAFRLFPSGAGPA